MCVCVCDVRGLRASRLMMLRRDMMAQTVMGTRCPNGTAGGIVMGVMNDLRRKRAGEEGGI